MTPVIGQFFGLGLFGGILILSPIWVPACLWYMYTAHKEG